MKYYILFNPLSGNGNAATKANELKMMFMNSGETEIEDITTIKDYAAFLGQIADDDVIVLCGGDGTINRFTNNIRGIELKCNVLYSACGTGNDFLNDLGKTADESPFSINEYIKDLPTVTINGDKSLFMNGIGFGIDGYCCEQGDIQKAQNPHTPVNYAGIAIQGVLGKFKPKNAKVTVDGKEYTFKKVWLAATMHGRFYGGGMNCAPEQNRLAGDGFNTLVVWHGSGKIKTLMRFSSIFKGEHVKYTKMIEVIKGKNISVEFDAPSALQIDGETVTNVTKYEVQS